MSENHINKKRKYHKSTFDKISLQKKQRILNAAMKEFSSHGYEGASINAIAKGAEISIGSLYSYFASKEDLFLSLIDMGMSLIRDVFENIDTNKNIFQVMEGILKTTKEYAINYPEINQIYLDLTTQSISKFSELISIKLEEITYKVYKQLISKGRFNGDITTKVSDDVIAFFLDNIVVTYQFSFSSIYYKKRMKIFIQRDYDTMDDIRPELMVLIKNSLCGK